MLWPSIRFLFTFSLLVLVLGGFSSASAQVTAPRAFYDDLSGSAGWMPEHRLLPDYCAARSPLYGSWTSNTFTGNPQFAPQAGVFAKAYSLTRYQCKTAGGSTIAGSGSVYVVSFCSDGYPVGNTGSAQTCTSCPSNTLNVGGVCQWPVTCTGGQVRDDATNTCGCAPPLVLQGGQCVSPCPAAGTSAIPAGKLAYGENALGVNPINAVLCSSSLCVMEIQQAYTVPIGDGKQANYITQAKYTGELATSAAVCPLTVVVDSPKDPTLPTPIDEATPAATTADGVPVLPTDCPPGSAFGTVNGVNVCSPSGAQVAYQPSSSTATVNGESFGTVTGKTSTVNDDGSVTTKTTTTSTGPNGEISTTVKESTGNQSVGIDGKDGADGKDAEGLDLGPAPLAESGEAPELTGLSPGAGVDGEGAAARTFAVTERFTGAASCIADRSINALGVTITVPLSELCPWFDIMYKLVTLFSVFAALRILVMA